MLQSRMPLLVGARYVVAALPFLFHRQLRVFVLGPLLANGLLFALVIAFGAARFDDLVSSLLPEWLRWLEIVLWAIVGVVALAVIFFCFSLVANILAAPFSGPLAAAVERLLDREPLPHFSSKSSLLRSALEDVSAEIAKAVYFTLWALPLVALLFVPIVSLFAPLLWFIYGAWALGLQYVDFPLGNHGLRFREQRQIFAGRPYTLLGFGLGMMGVTLTPVLNFVAVPTGVIGATLLCTHELHILRAGDTQRT